MRLSEITTADLREQRRAYAKARREETDASLSTRKGWAIVIAVLDAEILRRDGVRCVLDVTKMVRPGDEVLA